MPLLHGAGLTALLGRLAHRRVRQLAAFQDTSVRPVGRGTAETLVWLVSDWLWKLFRAKK